ncbi:MAG TPA: SBBP repeat-containing protein [Candidatus Binataceae bacterium]|nr:SBBP repeat-containing protein [Candidatus Binataceae bacterium]
MNFVKRTALVLAIMVSAAFGLPAQFAAAKPNPADRYGSIALSFEPNLGQSDSRVKFLSRGDGYTLFLTRDAAILSLRAPGAKGTSTFKSEVLQMSLAGSNPRAHIEGLGKLAGKSNYFVGRDPKKWRTNISNYSKVRYRGVYPGIDLVYYGMNQHQLEYDFVVEPGANPGVIAMRFDGAKQLSLNSKGDLVVKLASGGELIHRVPAIYQERDGKRERVSGKCVMLSKDTIGFELAAYDRGRAVYIDPALAYSTYLGGSGNNLGGNNAVGDSGNAIAIDSAGSAYVTGFTTSTDFPTTKGAFQSTLEAYGNAFVTKVSPDGKGLVYSTYLGGNGFDEGNGIAVGFDGSAYVVGFTQSADFPVTEGAFQTVLKTPNGNVFATKLSPDGSALEYSTYLGGNNYDFGAAIAVDSEGSAYLTGQTYSVKFPVTPGAFQTSIKSQVVGANAFVTKLTGDGTALVYSTLIGGGNTDYANAIAVDSDGYAYVTGVTTSISNADCTGLTTPQLCCTGAGSGACIEFPTTSTAYQTSLNGYSNAFVAKFSQDGTALAYSTFLGGSNYDQGNGIAVDSAGAAYVTGSSRSSDFPTTPGAFQTANKSISSNTNAFVTKMSADGSAIVYSTYVGGGIVDDSRCIAIDSAGNAYVAGHTSSPNFPTTKGGFQKSLKSVNGNAFITKVNGSGAALSYSTFLGGKTYDWANGIAVDPAGFAYITGLTASTNFPTTRGAYQGVNRAPGVQGGNAFVTKLSTSNARGASRR